MPSTDKLLPLVKPGDKILASVENDLRRQLNALGNAGADVHAMANAAGKFYGASKARLPKRYVAKIESTAIPGRVGDTPGSLSLPIYRFDEADGLVPVTKPDGTEVEYEVFNLSEDESETDTYVLVVEEGETGRLIAILGGGTETTTDDGFPPGTGGCPCTECVAGITIPDALECCTSLLRWSLKNPWLACATTDLILEYADNDTWLTDPFEGPDCDDSATTLKNEYRWQLTIDIDGRSYLTLLEETDNGCPAVCIIYGRESFNCQCANQFTIDKPYGTYIGVPRDDLACLACLKPIATAANAVCRDQHVAGYYRITLVEPGTFPDVEGYFPGGAGGDFIVGWYDLGDFPGCLLNPCGFTARAPGAWLVRYPYDLDPDEDVVAGMVCDGASRAVVAFSFCDQTFNTAFLSFASNTFNWEIGGELTQSSVCSTGFDTDLYEPATILVEPLQALSSPTSSGVCNESCTPTSPPANPAGFCCFEGSCYDYWDNALCTSFGGDWTASGTCADATCELVGPCCVAGTCLETDGYTCVSILGGTLAGGDCDDGVCDEGACCRSATGTCEETFEGDCQSPDYFAGVGTDCVSDPCPNGACCSKDTDGHNCECVNGANDDYTFAECQAATGGAGQWAPGMTCSEAETALGVCGETGGGVCEYGA